MVLTLRGLEDMITISSWVRWDLSMRSDPYFITATQHLWTRWYERPTPKTPLNRMQNLRDASAMSGGLGVRIGWRLRKRAEMLVSESIKGLSEWTTGNQTWSISLISTQFHPLPKTNSNQNVYWPFYRHGVRFVTSSSASLWTSIHVPRCCVVRLGNSGLKVSKIILGCMSYGLPSWYGWILEEEESLKHIKAAYDAGINAFDTANVCHCLFSYSKACQTHVLYRYTLTESQKRSWERLSRSTTSPGMRLSSWPKCVAHVQRLWPDSPTDTTINQVFGLVRRAKDAPDDASLAPPERTANRQGLSRKVRWKWLEPDAEAG